jgi:hypothetical protein
MVEGVLVRPEEADWAGGAVTAVDTMGLAVTAADTMALAVTPVSLAWRWFQWALGVQHWSRWRLHLWPARELRGSRGQRHDWR